MRCEEKEIRLSLEQRENLDSCPNCGSKKFELTLIPQPNHPLKEFRNRPIYRCVECGYWTDWFDGWIWHPPVMLSLIHI